MPEFAREFPHPYGGGLTTANLADFYALFREAVEGGSLHYKGTSIGGHMPGLTKWLEHVNSAEPALEDDGS